MGADLGRRAFVGVTLLAAGLATGTGQAQSDEGADYQVVPTPHPFPELETRLKAAIERAGMLLVTRASASDGARMRQVTIRGDAVYGVFRNDFAVRLLQANVNAGIEAPIRLHLTEEPDGTTSIRYWPPSAVFARYQGDEIMALGQELDPVFAAIVADAAGPN